MGVGERRGGKGMKYATELITSKKFGRILVRKAEDGEKSHKHQLTCNIAIHVFDTMEEAKEYGKKNQLLLRRKKEMATSEAESKKS
jgi:hypothetical protein